MLKVLLKLKPYIVKYYINYKEELKDDILTY